MAEENTRWGSDKITVEIKLIGERPAGMVAMDSPIVQAARRAVGGDHARRRASSLRAPAPTPISAMSLGIPAVTIGGGGEGGNWHSRNEWYKPVDAYHRPAKRAADDAGAGGTRWRDEAGAGGAARQVGALQNFWRVSSQTVVCGGRAAQPQVNSGLFKFEEPVTFNSKVKIGVRLRAPSAAAWDGQCPPRFTTRIGEPTGRSCWWAFCVARRSWASAFSPDSSPSTPRS